LALQQQNLDDKANSWEDLQSEEDDGCLLSSDIQSEDIGDTDEMLEDEEMYASENQAEATLSPNQVLVNLSWSLMNQLKFMSRNEGISVEDLLIELITEGTVKRVFEEQNRPMPSHLMTRNGYVHNTDGNMAPQQPQMSHHSSMPSYNKFSNNQQGGQQRPKHYSPQNRQNNPNYAPQGQRYNNNGNGGHYNKNFNGNGGGNGGQRQFQNGFYQGNGNQKPAYQNNYNGQNKNQKMNSQNFQGQQQNNYTNNNAGPRANEEHDPSLKNKK
jgi:hypothetical protein